MLTHGARSPWRGSIGIMRCMYPDVKSRMNGRCGMSPSDVRRRGVHWAAPVSAMWLSTLHTHWQVRSARSVHEAAMYPNDDAMFGTSE